MISAGTANKVAETKLMYTCQAMGEPSSIQHCGCPWMSFSSYKTRMGRENRAEMSQAPATK